MTTHLRKVNASLLVTRKKTLPFNSTGKEYLNSEILLLSNYDFQPGDLIIGEPEVVEGGDYNTRFLVTAREDHPEIEGSLYFYYNRFSIEGDFYLTGDDFITGRYPDAHSALPDLSIHTGMAFTAQDFVNHPQENDGIVFEPTANNYIFLPGTSIYL